MDKLDNHTVPCHNNSNHGTNQIENLIQIIRNQQVILDRDLACLYNVETRVLNQAVKRNPERFPEDFMFQLSKDEYKNLAATSTLRESVSLTEISSEINEELKSQNVISNNTETNESSTRRGGVRKLPYAFTENGVAMLSSVLRSKTAIEVNIRIMRAFTSMRSFLMSNANIFRRLETIEHNYLLVHRSLSEYDQKFEDILSKLDEKESEPIEGFFFDGQVFDAYTLISDLVRKAKTRIILIDNYVDDRVLKALDKRKEKVTALIYTNPRNSQIDEDLRKHNAQYPKINLKYCSNVHDRFLIIDETIYFIGGSIKDLGKKIVAFSRMSQSPDDILSKLR